MTYTLRKIVGCFLLFMTIGLTSLQAVYYTSLQSIFQSIFQLFS